MAGPIDLAPPPTDLVEATTRFCRLLRSRGLLASPEESIDAVRALATVDLGDRTDVYLALRVLLTSRREELAIFDDAFGEWWRAEPRPRPDASGGPNANRSVPGPSPVAPPPSIYSLKRWGAASDAGDEEASVPSPSTHESLATKDFETFGADELDEIQRIATRMARRLTSRPSRRWKPQRRGARVHLRGILRQLVKSGGDVVELTFRERRLRKTSVVALCDVSGSMDLYSRFLLQFLYALQRSFARVESFVFSTGLTRVTEQLSRRTYREALDRLSRDVRGWSSGTAIGTSVASFVTEWPRLVDRRTIVIVLSDGWDTGDPAILGEAMRQIHRRAGRVIWLNPLLGSPGYQPLTRGMQAALPHIDVFAPGHNLESLERLVRHLVL